MKRLLLGSLVGMAAFAIATGNADASHGKHHKYHYYGKRWTGEQHHFVAEPHHHQIRRSIDGHPIDHEGWRYWNATWDNTCFRTLDYLSSMSACSGGGA